MVLAWSVCLSNRLNQRFILCEENIVVSRDRSEPSSDAPGTEKGSFFEFESSFFPLSEIFSGLSLNPNRDKGWSGGDKSFWKLWIGSHPILRPLFYKGEDKWDEVSEAEVEWFLRFFVHGFYFFPVLLTIVLFGPESIGLPSSLRPIQTRTSSFSPRAQLAPPESQEQNNTLYLVLGLLLLGCFFWPLR